MFTFWTLDINALPGFLTMAVSNDKRLYNDMVCVYLSRRSTAAATCCSLGAGGRYLDRYCCWQCGRRHAQLRAVSVLLTAVEVRGSHRLVFIWRATKCWTCWVLMLLLAKNIRHQTTALRLVLKAIRRRKGTLFTKNFSNFFYNAQDFSYCFLFKFQNFDDV